MITLFESREITHSDDETKYENADVVIDSSNSILAGKNITFEFTKNGSPLIVKEAEYSFTTQVFSMIPKDGDLITGDVIKMYIKTA